jgi:hypothetical protein
MTTYNNIGGNYNKTRKADPRITHGIISLLGRPKNADIGAGTGNYSYELAKYGYKDCWIKKYFKELYDKAAKTLPDRRSVIGMVERAFKNKCEVNDFRLPPDLKDGFFYSAWRNPERYLDKEFRSGISVFSLADEARVNRIITGLEMDLQNGAWDREYGQVRNLEEYNGGYYFLKVEKL